jgi:hypothetical protein
VTAIRTDQLTKRYASTMALDALDLTVREGEVYGHCSLSPWPGSTSRARRLGRADAYPTKASTRAGLPVPSTSRSGATTISAPVGGSLASFAS